jgi:glycosyltransferase involved in cell wall biosynthesis
MINPFVSIIIPVHNGERYLAETIQSALNQTWQHREIIIIDDGSTDNSLEIARSFERDSVKIIGQSNKGAAAARNAGLKEAKGDYVQFLDADDLLSPDKIQAQIDSLNGSLTHVAICKTVHFDDGESHLDGIENKDWFCKNNDDPVTFLTKLYAGDDMMPGFGGMITVHSWLTPRTIIEKAGQWNEKLGVDDDGEFFCRIVLASEGICFSHRGINYYRKYRSGRSLSAQKNKKAIESAVLAIDLKLKHLTARSDDDIVSRVFGKHYWWTGVMAYPQYRGISAYCIQQAKKQGYAGEKYVGGKSGHILAAIIGWKLARLIVWYWQILKQRWI